MTTNMLTPLREEAEPGQAPAPGWSLPLRASFRFVFCYLLLYCLPSTGQVSIAELIPRGEALGTPWIWLWHRIIPWIAIHVFHLQGERVTYFRTGSGDTTLDYVQCFVYLIVAAVAALVWSILDRKRAGYGTLYAWLRVLVRLTLALTLLNYGVAKVIPTQFRPPNLVQLSRTYGEGSPMGLLWTFMGASMPYTIFSGLAEVTGGVLLLFRRTTMLGALVAAGVMLNVAMLNYCYDVPVKLYSTHLLLMAIFLLIPDFSRLADLFLFNRNVPPAELELPLLSRRWMRVTATTLKLVFVLIFAGSTAWGGWQYLQGSKFGGEPPLFGVYEIDGMQVNGAADNAASHQWKQLIAERGFWMIKKVDGTRDYSQARYLPKTNAVELTIGKQPLHFTLNYVQPDAQHLTLTGKMPEGNVEVHLHRVDGKNFLLTRRGFHWINEQPFNR